MGLFSFLGSSKTQIQTIPAETALPSQQVEQRSHQPLNLASPQTSDISDTLNKITDHQSAPLRVTTIDSNYTAEEVDGAVTGFVQAKPNNLFIIDGEKQLDQSIICTSDPDGGKTCLKLQINSIELFKTMQKLEYFCSLPDDIDATYFECRKIK
ncbi:uncharacterized protein RJT20DRAFT_28958 [Scheffersomyces xylosifermentans]|uniref:uncharacterized protein n=1 Tax=Scheffersomyces xylosifermentans TaxID=1304137 RepID=UPI00315DBC0E